MAVTENVPARLQHRPRDHRGYVIPFVTHLDQNGEAQFKIISDERAKRCLDHRLCALCGAPMGRHIFFIGGDLCVANGIFYDPPMHRDCAEYALRTCPHIVHAPGKLGRVPQPKTVGAPVLGVGAAGAATRFALMHGERYSYRRQGVMLLIQAALPWLDVTWYREGKPCP
jgi:hypothetical protein